MASTNRRTDDTERESRLAEGVRASMDESISSMDVNLRSRDSARAFDGLMATLPARARVIHGRVVASSVHGTAFVGVGVGTNRSTRVIHGCATG